MSIWFKLEKALIFSQSLSNQRSPSLTAQKRNRLFSYTGYIEIMNHVTELPSG